MQSVKSMGASKSIVAITVASMPSRRTFGVTVTGRRLPARFRQTELRKQAMRMSKNLCLGLLASFAAMTAASAQQQQKPNILFIMGDDIGWMQPSIYHRG